MAKNDTLLLDGILDDRVQQRIPSEQRDEAFEYFAFQQILRDADLNHDEILSGAVDGRDDGGIDGLFILVNGNLLTDPSSFFWPRHNAHLTVHVITCKHHDTFKQAPIDNLVATISEYFDLSIQESQLSGSYSRRLLRFRETLSTAYRRLSPRLQSFEVKFCYASRGDRSIVGSSIIARSNQAVEKVRELFGNVVAEFDFCGAAELVAIHRKARRQTHELPFEEGLSAGQQYAVLCKLKDYSDFISDESGNLRRYMFDSNIRAFMGLNRVNEDIRDTLASPSTSDFWWLNNGITILASSASVVGKSLNVDEPQIVNGLQTSESIYRHFQAGGTDDLNRCVLVKIIVTEDTATRDAIIRSTNNQTNVELASLHATDKVQRDIEDYLRINGLFYERRKNYYVSQGVHPQELITPMYLAAGFVALVLKSPRRATQLRSKFMRDPVAYDQVFSEQHQIQIWPQIALILKRVDDVLNSRRPLGVGKGERFLKSWRYLTALLAVSRVTKKFTFSQSELAGLQVELLTEQLLRECWDLIVEHAKDGITSSLSHKQEFIISVCREAALVHGLSGVQSIANGNVPKVGNISSSFLEAVDRLLPEQPWKPGVHRLVAGKLHCNPAVVSQAIQELISLNRRNAQRDGVVFDQDGNVLAVDAERATTASRTADSATDQT